MKLRNTFVSILGLAAGLYALPGYSHTVEVDETIFCSSVMPATGNLSIDLLVTAKGNRAKSGLNLPVLACLSTKKTNTNLTPLAFNAPESYLYTWVDLSLAGGTPEELGLIGPGAIPLSNYEVANVSIVAMIDVFKLTGAYSGDREIVVNFESFPESACDNLFVPLAPSFTWFGHTYTFTGGTGIGTVCDPANGNDFLFGSANQLLGYNSAPQGSSTFVLTPGLPPGWTSN